MHISPQPLTETRKFLVDEEGASFYEFVLVASLTVVVGIIVLLALGKGW
jgi:Flp pilus assembly pilin Flp